MKLRATQSIAALSTQAEQESEAAVKTVIELAISQLRQDG